ncbi:hypothetical protein GGX14DRAFT_390395 [Mycena pura]|uniref:Uncharacterized protein n=1 Tax=Mycena pura TaxID=153505 RepID=A0AAD6YGH8_9AGAR|nr:hypothetical protein GGX14DRAFT_390395 [Mycena pura]
MPGAPPRLPILRIPAITESLAASARPMDLRRSAVLCSWITGRLQRVWSRTSPIRCDCLEAAHAQLEEQRRECMPQQSSHYGRLRRLCGGTAFLGQVSDFRLNAGLGGVRLSVMAMDKGLRLGDGASR